MCRWFAYISAQEPILLYDVLVAPDNALIYQVKSEYMGGLFPHKRGDNNPFVEEHLKGENKLMNINLDGFGVAWYSCTASDFDDKIEGDRPQKYKTIQPPINDSNFQSLAKNTGSKCVLAHVRQASPPGIIHLYNNHPFLFDRHVLQHNGGIAHFALIRYKMVAEMSPKALANIGGATDSEHFGKSGLYMTYLTGKEEDWSRQYTIEEMKAALFKAIDRVIQLQVEAVPEKDLKPSNLNMCVTDGEQLVATRFRNSIGADNMPNSLYYSTTAGATLNRRYDGAPNSPFSPDHWRSHGTRDPEQHKRHVIVCSEPTTYKPEEWISLDKNQFILVGKDSRPVLGPVPVFKAFPEVPLVVLRLEAKV